MSGFSLEAVLLVMQVVLNSAIPYFIVRRDLRRLSPGELGRCWPVASFWAAVITFGPLCLPVHFVKSRGSLLGLLLGLGWMVAAFAALAAFGAVVALAFDVPTE